MTTPTTISPAPNARIARMLTSLVLVMHLGILRRLCVGRVRKVRFRHG